ncbi:hypothetical protein JNUCC1_02169 [Lentibacillus sp. JNUCC-1]|uniref:hypothetical protein n=1 Tax=Lentibacillus sp. JNUCC-1 TaxID=2654513 RepID=UPI0012E90459|nr:hypothetical protein [Lentibacillus sp. JNUCC-1]MUV38331.1 hypothetical protein [Lentibacillus sp. JNUCC-1]
MLKEATSQEAIEAESLALLLWQGQPLKSFVQEMTDLIDKTVNELSCEKVAS